MMTGLIVLTAMTFVALLSSEEKTGMALAYSVTVTLMVAYQIWCEMPK